jgi:hypothetical protein
MLIDTDNVSKFYWEILEVYKVRRLKVEATFPKATSFWQILNARSPLL